MRKSFFNFGDAQTKRDEKALEVAIKVITKYTRDPDDMLDEPIDNSPMVSDDDWEAL
jgi:hypothetical protein